MVVILDNLISRIEPETLQKTCEKPKRSAPIRQVDQFDPCKITNRREKIHHVLYLVDGPLAATTADTHAVNDVSLLGLVSHAASLVGAAGLPQAVDAGELTELPATHAEKEAEHIAVVAQAQKGDEKLSSVS